VPDTTVGTLEESVQASVAAFAAELKSLLEYELLVESVRNCECYSSAFRISFIATQNASKHLIECILK
jgi:hypothetical protein